MAPFDVLRVWYFVYVSNQQFIWITQHLNEEMICNLWDGMCVSFIGVLTRNHLWITRNGDCNVHINRLPLKCQFIIVMAYRQADTAINQNYQQVYHKSQTCNRLVCICFGSFVGVALSVQWAIKSNINWVNLTIKAFFF